MTTARRPCTTQRDDVVTATCLLDFDMVAEPTGSGPRHRQTLPPCPLRLPHADADPLMKVVTMLEGSVIGIEYHRLGTEAWCKLGVAR